MSSLMIFIVFIQLPAHHVQRLPVCLVSVAKDTLKSNAVEHKDGVVGVLAGVSYHVAYTLVNNLDVMASLCVLFVPVSLILSLLSCIGDCGSCPEVIVQRCICGTEMTDRSCDSPAWACDKQCSRSLPCGNHLCAPI